MSQMTESRLKRPFRLHSVAVLNQLLRKAQRASNRGIVLIGLEGVFVGQCVGFQLGALANERPGP